MIMEKNKKLIEINNDQLLYSTDAVTKHLFSGGIYEVQEYKARIPTASKKEKKKGMNIGIDIILYFRDNDNITIRVKQSLDDYDRQLLYVYLSLYTSGKREVSTYALWKKMGFKGNFSGSQRTRLIESLKKLFNTIIYISNQSERDARDNAPEIEIRKAQLLYYEWVIGYNGKRIIKDVIEMKAEPAILKYLVEYGQFTLLPDDIFRLPENKKKKTDLQISIQNELIDMIIFKKHNPKKAPEKYSIKNLATKLGLTDKTQVRRLTDDIKTILEYYRNLGFIKEYKVTKTHYSV